MNRSKVKGTSAETAVVDYLRVHGWQYAERRALRGHHDEGDVAGVPGLVIEVKACNRVELAEWISEACTEGGNAERRTGLRHRAVVWFKRRGKASPGSWYVLMTGATFVELLEEPSATEVAV